jgi:phosphoribosylcarboxyaminoimidazole (NCAIR) mutase
LAAAVLALSDKVLAKKLDAFRAKQTKKIPLRPK